MSMKWVTYKGKQIITIDYTGMDENSILSQMDLYFDAIKNETEVRHLTKFAYVLLTKEFREKAREMEIRNTSNKKVKIALLGINKYQKANVSTYSFFTKVKAQAFDSEKEAMDWLASD
jgi:hypothetical protein